jgi:hypothetical protein
MLMRFHFGLGVGHVYSHHRATPAEHQREDSAGKDPAGDGDGDGDVDGMGMEMEMEMEMKMKTETETKTETVMVTVTVTVTVTKRRMTVPMPLNGGPFLATNRCQSNSMRCTTAKWT